MNPIRQTLSPGANSLAQRADSAQPQAKGAHAAQVAGAQGTSPQAASGQGGTASGGTETVSISPSAHPCGR